MGDYNMLELQGIASKPMPSNLFLVKSYKQFPDIVEKIRMASCDGNSNPFLPPNDFS